MSPSGNRSDSAVHVWDHTQTTEFSNMRKNQEQIIEKIGNGIDSRVQHVARMDIRTGDIPQEDNVNLNHL